MHTHVGVVQTLKRDACGMPRGVHDLGAATPARRCWGSWLLPIIVQEQLQIMQLLEVVLGLLCALDAPFELHQVRVVLDRLEKVLVACRCGSLLLNLLLRLLLLRLRLRLRPLLRLLLCLLLSTLLCFAPRLALLSPPQLRDQARQLAPQLELQRSPPLLLLVEPGVDGALLSFELREVGRQHASAATCKRVGRHSERK